MLQVTGNLGAMLTAAGGRKVTGRYAVANVGCGGSKPSIPTDFPIPTALYVVAA